VAGNVSAGADDELEQAPSATTRATTGINASEFLANRFIET